MSKALSQAAAAFAFLFAASLLPPPAHADGFKIYTLGGDNVRLLGINSTGDVLLQQFSGCNGSGDPNFCYEEFTAGSLAYRSDLAPTDFVAENGTPCMASGSPDFTPEGRSVCNGGLQVLGGYEGDMAGVWETSPGTGSSRSLVYQGSADVLFVNGAGDFAVANGAGDAIYQVVGVAPEPAALFLLGTGTLVGIGLLRRRIFPSS